jgi:hypothetical protein
LKNLVHRRHLEVENVVDVVEHVQQFVDRRRKLSPASRVATVTTSTFW